MAVFVVVREMYMAHVDGGIKQEIQYICSLQRPVIQSFGTAFCVKQNVLKRVLKYVESAVMLGNEFAPEGSCIYVCTSTYI